jgi:hypothetical protein
MRAGASSGEMPGEVNVWRRHSPKTSHRRQRENVIFTNANGCPDAAPSPAELTTEKPHVCG